MHFRIHRFVYKICPGLSIRLFYAIYPNLHHIGSEPPWFYYAPKQKKRRKQNNSTETN